jgi:preprotein translocase subunit SecF
MAMKDWTLLFITFIFIFSSTIMAESKIYYWVDKNGESHFSDTAAPETNPEEVNIRNQNLLVNKQKNQVQNEEAEIQLEVPTNQPSISYKADITSPSEGATIHSNEGTINIQVSITPEKKTDDTLQLYLDGKKIGTPQRSPTMRALNIDRGTHQVQVFILDKAGNILTKTQIVTVYVQKTIAN